MNLRNGLRGIQRGLSLFSGAVRESLNDDLSKCAVAVEGGDLVSVEEYSPGHYRVSVDADALGGTSDGSSSTITNTFITNIVNNQVFNQYITNIVNQVIEQYITENFSQQEVVCTVTCNADGSLTTTTTTVYAPGDAACA